MMSYSAQNFARLCAQRGGGGQVWRRLYGEENRDWSQPQIQKKPAGGIGKVTVKPGYVRIGDHVRKEDHRDRTFLVNLKLWLFGKWGDEI